MGHRSRSPPRRRTSPQSRHQDRCRERKRDRDRFDVKKASDVKRRVRDGLDAAMTHSSSAPSLSSNDLANRSRAIEQLEEGGFQPATFKSTAGGAGGRVYGHKKGKAQDEPSQHDQAMFGPSPRNVKKESESIPMPTMTAAPKEGIQMFHPLFLEDPEIRKEKWLSIWRGYRNTLGAA